MTWTRELDQWGQLCAEKDAEIAALRRQLEQERDLTEWMKHALSEQSWHFRATVEALQLQYKHDQKRGFKDTFFEAAPVEAAKQQVVEGTTVYRAGAMWGKGQRS